MLKEHHKKFLIAAFGGFLTFYCLFFTLIAFFLSVSEPIAIYNIPVAVTMSIFEGLCGFPLALLVGFPLFLLSLMICNRLTSRFYLSVVCHALLAVPLSGLVLGSADLGVPHIVQDWHDIVGLAAWWLEASLPSGAVEGLTSWALRPPPWRKRI